MLQFVKSPTREDISGYYKIRNDLIEHANTILISSKNLTRDIVKKHPLLPKGSVVDGDLYGPSATYFSLTVPGTPWIKSCECGHCVETRKVVVSFNDRSLNDIFCVAACTIDPRCSGYEGRYKMEPTTIPWMKPKLCSSIDSVIDEIIVLTKQLTLSFND